MPPSATPEAPGDFATRNQITQTPMRRLSQLQSLGQVMVNLRRPWQLIFSTVLCVYTVLYAGSQRLRVTHMIPALSSLQCDHTCDFLCGIDQSSFKSADHEVETTLHSFPGWAWVPLTIEPRMVRLRSHANETWWFNPRQTPAYCQWSWEAENNQEPESHIMLDEHFGSPRRTTFWADVPGKYFGGPWDEIQNIMALSPDAAVRAVLQSHVILHYLPLFLGLSLLGFTSFALWQCIAMSFVPFGTLRYTLQLESLVNTRARRRLNTLSVSLWVFICLMFVGLSNSAGAGMSYAARGLLLFIVNGLSCYSLISEVTPVTPDMLSRAPADTPLPVPWYQPNSRTIAQLFAVLLVPEKALRRAKEEGTSAFLSEHIDSRFIDRLELKELLRIREMIWAQDSTYFAQMTLRQQIAPADGAVRKPEKSWSCCLSKKAPTSPRVERHYQGPRNAWIAPLLKHLNLLCSLKELWLLWLSGLSCCNSLLDIAAIDSSYADCLCQCKVNTPSTTFQDCYQRSMENQARWLKAKDVVMIVFGLIGAACVLAKLNIDRSQVHEVPYGSLEYIIRLELRKRSMANRVIVIITSICVLGTTIVLLIVATVRIAQDRRTHAELLIFLLELAMQAVACRILSSEMGFLTPASAKDVPEVHLPMRWYTSSEVVLTRLMKLVSLDDTEISALPDNLSSLADRRLSHRIATRVRATDLVRIKHFLRREGVSGGTERRLPTGQSFLRSLTATLKIHPLMGRTLREHAPGGTYEQNGQEHQDGPRAQCDGLQVITIPDSLPASPPASSPQPASPEPLVDNLLQSLRETRGTLASSVAMGSTTHAATMRPASPSSPSVAHGPESARDTRDGQDAAPHLRSDADLEDQGRLV